MRIFVDFNPPDQIGHGGGVEKHQTEIKPVKLPGEMVNFRRDKRAGDNHHEPFGPVFFEDKTNTFDKKTAA